MATGVAVVDLDQWILLCCFCDMIHHSMAAKLSNVQPRNPFVEFLKVGNEPSPKYWEFLLPNSFVQDKCVIEPLDVGTNELSQLSLDLTWSREDLDLPCARATISVD
jgi:hypothetical protein